MAKYRLSWYTWLAVSSLMFVGCQSIFVDFSAPYGGRVSVPTVASVATAVHHYERKEYDRAVYWIRKALERDNSSPELFLLAAKIEFGRRNPLSGLNYLEKALSVSEKNALYQLEVAQAYQRYNFLAQAIQLYVRLLRQGTYREYVSEELVKILRFLKRPKLSRVVLEATLAEFPPGEVKDRGRLLLLESYRQLKMFEKARELFQQADSKLRERQDWLLERVFLHLAEGATQKAAQVCRQALELYPKSGKVLYALAVVLEREGKEREARLAYRRALELLLQRGKRRKQSRLALSQRFVLAGEISWRLKQYSQGVKYFLKALEVYPSNRQAALLLCHFFETNKYPDLVAQVLEFYLSHSPYDREVQGELAFVYSEHGLRLERAIQLAQECLMAYPLNGRYLYALGWAYLQKYEFHKAISLLHQAWASWKSFSVAEKLAKAYFCLGNLEEAAKWYQKALQLKPASKALRTQLQLVRQAQGGLFLP